MFSILVSVQFGHYRLNPGNAQNFLGRKLLLGLSILNTLWRDFIINKRTYKIKDRRHFVRFKYLQS